MADLYDILAGTLGSEKDYYSDDPYIGIGANLLKAQMPAAQTNSQAFLFPFLQGALGGGLVNIGKENANQKAFKDYGDILGKLNPEYATDQMPEGWTVRKGQTQAVLEMLKAKTINDIEQKKEEIRAKLAADYSPETIAGKALIAEQEAASKERGRVSALKELYGDQGGGSTLPLDPEQRAKTILDLEDKTYRRIADLPSFKQFSDIEGNFKTMAALKDKESAAAAPAMISSFARVLDPASTVREGEYKTVSTNVQSYLDQIQGNWRKAMEGKTSLSKEAREAMVEIAAQKYNEFGSKYNKERDPLLEALKGQGGNPSHIPTPQFEPFSPGTTQPGGVPGIGSIFNGEKVLSIKKIG